MATTTGCTAQESHFNRNLTQSGQANRAGNGCHSKDTLSYNFIRTGWRRQACSCICGQHGEASRSARKPRERRHRGEEPILSSLKWARQSEDWMIPSDPRQRVGTLWGGGWGVEPAFRTQTVGKVFVIPKHCLTLPGATCSDPVGRRQEHDKHQGTALISFSDGHRLSSGPQRPGGEQWDQREILGYSAGLLAPASRLGKTCCRTQPGSCWLLIKGIRCLPPRTVHGVRAHSVAVTLRSPRVTTPSGSIRERGNEAGERKAQYPSLGNLGHGILSLWLNSLYWRRGTGVNPSQRKTSWECEYWELKSWGLFYSWPTPELNRKTSCKSKTRTTNLPSPITWQ